jgi:hypothetical protein
MEEELPEWFRTLQKLLREREEKSKEEEGKPDAGNRPKRVVG